MAGLSISSAEFQRAFGRYREAALKGPLTITNHGRDSLVLMAVDEYQRLKSRDRVALRAEDLSEDDFRAITKGQNRTATVRAEDWSLNTRSTASRGKTPDLSASPGTSTNRFRSLWVNLPSPSAPSAKDVRQ